MPWPGEYWRWRAHLDYSAQSSMCSRTTVPGRRDVQSRPYLFREARIYPSGELTVVKRMVKAVSRVPEVRCGRRWMRGMTSRGARTMQRAIVAGSRDGRAQVNMLTFTSQQARSDEDMVAAWGRFLDRVVKHPQLGRYFERYAWVKQDQARGVLHFHLVILRRIPPGLYRRVRAIWCDEYGMGPGAVNGIKFRSARGAAKYVAKYVSGGRRHHRVTLDGEGMLQFTPWPVSRHTGEGYVRDRIPGNVYGMSRLMREGTVPVVTFQAAAGAFPGLDGWHGTRRFYDDAETAERVLEAVLQATGPPVDDAPHG